MASPRSGSRRPAAARGFGLLIPAVAWALCFVALYGLQGAGCAAGLQDQAVAGIGLLRLALGVIVLAALAVVGWAGLSARRQLRRAGAEDAGRRPDRFLAALTLLSAGLFSVAVIWVGFPLVVFDPCAGHILRP